MKFAKRRKLQKKETENEIDMIFSSGKYIIIIFSSERYSEIV